MRVRHSWGRGGQLRGGRVIVTVLSPFLVLFPPLKAAGCTRLGRWRGLMALSFVFRRTGGLSIAELET